MSHLQYRQKEKSSSFNNVSITNDLHYWLALHYAHGIGPAAYQRLLTHCPEPRLFFESTSDWALGEELNLNKKTLAYFRSPDWDRVE